MTATVISLVAFKGGVAKTSSTAMIAYNLAKRGYKVIMLDLDPQANLTAISLRTKLSQLGENANTVIDSSLMKAVQDGDLSEAKINIMPNLDLIGSSMDFSLYPDYMIHKYKGMKAQTQYLNTLLEPIIKDYNFCIIDTPPTLSLYLSSALYASDYALCLLKTDPFSLEGLEHLLQYIQNKVINEYGAPRLEPLGVLPVIMQRNSSLDKGILDMIRTKYGDDMILPPVPYLSRLNRFSATGITDTDYFDQRPQKVYTVIVDEILKKVKANEE